MFCWALYRSQMILKWNCILIPFVNALSSKCQFRLTLWQGCQPATYPPRFPFKYFQTFAEIQIKFCPKSQSQNIQKKKKRLHRALSSIQLHWYHSSCVRKKKTWPWSTDALVRLRSTTVPEPFYKLVHLFKTLSFGNICCLFYWILYIASLFKVWHTAFLK